MTYQKLKKRKESVHSFYVQLVSGSFAGTASQLTFYPIETIKTIYQHNPKDNYLKITCDIYKNGIKNFWKGASVPSITFGIVNGVSFSTYYTIRKYYSNKEPLNDYHIIVASTVSGIIQLIPWIPSEVIKIRMQKKANLASATNITVISTAKDVYKLHGIRGFYKGALAQSTRDVPNNVVYFYTYEKLSKFLENEFNLNPILKAFISGGITGTIAWVVVIPMDLFKTRIQSGADKNPSQFFKNVFQTSNISPFHGSFASTFRAFCVNALIFVIYEQLTPILSDYI